MKICYNKKWYGVTIRQSHFSSLSARRAERERIEKKRYGLTADRNNYFKVRKE
jgi:hypothetical protein